MSPWNQSDEADWQEARDLADKLEAALEKQKNAGDSHDTVGQGNDIDNAGRSLIHHIRRITPARRKPAAPGSADDM